MKKIIIALCIFFVCSKGFSQWQPETQLTNNPSSSLTTLNSVASSGNTVHTVWSDNRDGNTEIYYKRSTDAGITWGTDTRLTNASDYSLRPSITVSGVTVHVVWYDNRDGNTEIYYKRSTDAGSSWSADTRLTVNTDISQDPSLAVSGTTVYVVWIDLRNAGFDLFLKKSTDNGVNWGPDTPLSSNGGPGEYTPVISVSGSIVHVAWQDNRNSSTGEVYYKRSADNGVNFGPDIRLTNDPASSNYVSISSTGTNVNIVWLDTRTGQSEIFYKRSTDSGASWGTDTRLTMNGFSSGNPSVSSAGSNIHVVYSGNSGIYYKRSTDGGNTWSSDLRLSDIVSFARDPSIAISGSAIHVIWHDARSSDEEVYYERNPTGNPTAILPVNSIIPKNFSLGQNFPNPFNPETKIKFDIPAASFTTLKIYSIQGNEVVSLLNNRMSAGSYEVEWNAANYPSGVYFYKLVSGDFNKTIKMILMK